MERLLSKSSGFLIENCRLKYLFPVVGVPLLGVFLKNFLSQGQKGSPFSRDARRPKAPYVLDRSTRREVLKNGFQESKIPQDLDAIVIGSGIGGLSVASMLAKVNKKVLVLEQHGKAGGCCHTFAKKGFEFDVGIHYIGELEEDKDLRLLIDQLTEGQLAWQPLDNNFDTIVLANKDSGEPAKVIPLRSGGDAHIQSFIDAFPDEEETIRRFFALVQEAMSSMPTFILLKMLPLWLSRFLIRCGVVPSIRRLKHYSERSVKSVLDEVTSNDDLKAALGYCFGDYGVPSTEASFLVHALLLNHYKDGAYYPFGGASEIAFHIIPTIVAAGGRVLTSARVTGIVDDGHGRVVGVRVTKGSQEVEVRAPIVVSDAGIVNTVRMLSKDVLEKSRSPLSRVVSAVKPGYGCMSVYIGLRGTSEELNLPARNYWIFKGNKIDDDFAAFMSMDSADLIDATVPLLYVSFPSAKDPTFEQRYPGNSCCAVITFAPWEWFESWKDAPKGRRGEEYNELKQIIARAMWKQTCELFPHLKDKEGYFEVGTPLTNQHYIGSSRGEIYGMNHDTTRFSLQSIVDMRPDTQIPGLYLTGQDVCACGFAGAIFGGLICASTILQRNLQRDLQKLGKSLNNRD